MKSAVPYHLGFTAVSLRPELARIVAGAFVLFGDWEIARANVLAGNSLQAKTPAGAQRMERELRQRLKTLTPRQLHILAQSSVDERAAMAWLAVMKFSAFPFEFATDVLREKLASHDEILRRSDYESFIDERSAGHPELAGLAASTRRKIRSMLRRMLFEAGLLTQGPQLGHIQRPILSPDAEQAIRADDPRWLAGFLVPDSEINHG
jgi:hypothetical protein